MHLCPGLHIFPTVLYKRTMYVISVLNNVRLFYLFHELNRPHADNRSQIAKFVGPTWGPPGDDGIQVGPMLAPRTLLSGVERQWIGSNYAWAVTGNLGHQLPHTHQIESNVMTFTMKRRFIYQCYHKRIWDKLMCLFIGEKPKHKVIFSLSLMPLFNLL